MENVNTIELNGQLYDIEDATARTTAEQNSKELVKVKETANSAQTTAATAQTSASTAQTTANEAKTIAATAQTTANEAKESAATKQPLLGAYQDLAVDAKTENFLTASQIQSLTNIVLNETPPNIESMAIIIDAKEDNFQILGSFSIFQESGDYHFGLQAWSSKITIRYQNNQMYIKNNTDINMELYIIPQGFMNV